MKITEIRKEIYKLGKAATSKEFRWMFPEFKSYSLVSLIDMLEIKGCFESEPEALEKVLQTVKRKAEVVDLLDWRINNGKLTVTDAITEAISLNQEIQDECAEILAWSKSVRF